MPAIEQRRYFILISSAAWPCWFALTFPLTVRLSLATTFLVLQRRSIIFVDVGVCRKTNALTVTVVIYIGIVKWRRMRYPTPTTLLLLVALQCLARWLSKSPRQLVVAELFSIRRYWFLHRVSAYFTAWVTRPTTWWNFFDAWVVIGGDTNWSWLRRWVVDASCVSSLMRRWFIIIEACTRLLCSNWHCWRQRTRVSLVLLRPIALSCAYLSLLRFNAFQEPCEIGECYYHDA